MGPPLFHKNRKKAKIYVNGTLKKKKKLGAPGEKILEKEKLFFLCISKLCNFKNRGAVWVVWEKK